jgi:hypothetical protein
MATHKAWRLHAHNDLRFDDVETPTPAPDGVLVKIEAGMVLSYMGRVLSGAVPYGLAAESLLDLQKIMVTTFKLSDFKRAIEAAALMQGLDLTAVVA